ncbi:Aldo/keto reductase [Microstroma glucosiphilum]|uniref:Aldo/keto reductase n=1 Tax=Pseudomicrostroma glucosiphilum TaxID=1684307 RepID=A0A316UAJ1_9BASI|nr:Aldo/keto reductase [Pseudomicrostroma glucosiphilum]PWN21868.1 Aldo/keto reductase [Pseudomicrostroma glucosiphilum]
MSYGKTIKLNDGNVIPQLGLGTWLSKPGEVKNAVIEAAKIGYKHFDLARIYCNQEEVGAGFAEVFKQGIAKREDLFITSKLWNNAHQPHLVEKAYEHTLKQLGLDYLDLYLIHWPVPFVPSNDDIESDEKLMPPSPENKDFIHLDLKTTLAQTWKAMVDLQKSGKVKSVGVSNFLPSHIEGISQATGVVPAVNQIERHALLFQSDLVEYCKFKGVHLTAYSPLGNSANYLAGNSDAKLYDLVNCDEVQEVAKEHGAEPGQVLIAWGIQDGLSLIPKSVTPARIKKNFEQIELTPEQYKKVSSRIRTSGHKRFNIPWNYSPKWSINVFGETIEVQHAEHQVNIA